MARNVTVRIVAYVYDENLDKQATRQTTGFAKLDDGEPWTKAIDIALETVDDHDEWNVPPTALQDSLHAIDLRYRL
jgi:hypothetical protein